MAFQTVLRQPFFAGVDAAHHALQLGELAHHVGREVGLGQPRRPRRLRRPRLVDAPSASPAIHAREALDPLRLLLVGAELLVEQQRRRADRSAIRASPCRSASQKNRASRSRAVTTRSALRAIVRSLSGSVLMTARNAVFSLPVLVLDRKVVLMMDQRRRQHFFGQLEELRARTCRRRPTGTRRGPALRCKQPGLAVHDAADAALAAAAPWRRARARSCRGARCARG